MEITWDNGNESSAKWLWFRLWGSSAASRWNGYSAVSQGLTFGQHRINYVRRKLKERYKHEKYQEDLVFKHPWTITAVVSRQTATQREYYPYREDDNGWSGEWQWIHRKGDTGTGILQWDSNVHFRFRDDVFFKSYLKSAWCL